MSFQKFSFINRLSSIRVVCGSAVEYCDPYDIDSVVCSLVRVLGDSKFRAQLSTLGRKL